MRFQNCFKSLASTLESRRTTRRDPPKSRLRIEPLEERRLLAFSRPVDYGADLAPIGLVAADFNGDGRPDLAALDKANTVNVLLGNGDGTLQLPRTSGAGAGSSSCSRRSIPPSGRWRGWTRCCGASPDTSSSCEPAVSPEHAGGSAAPS